MSAVSLCSVVVKIAGPYGLLFFTTKEHYKWPKLAQ